MAVWKVVQMELIVADLRVGSMVEQKVAQMVVLMAELMVE